MASPEVSQPRAIARAREDFSAGRLWKAVDRLEGFLGGHPAHQEALELLGEVHFKMGNLPQAGRYWWLTCYRVDSVQAALEAFHERYGRSPDEVLKGLPITTVIDQYPPDVRERVMNLVSKATSNKWGAWTESGAKAKKILGQEESDPLSGVFDSDACQAPVDEADAWAMCR